MKKIEVEFGSFTFLDDTTVVAEAKKGVEIDGEKVSFAIEIIEKELPGDYAMILDRKHDYSVLPVPVYQYFASRERLKALAIVSHRVNPFLPEGMEKRIFGRDIETFYSVEMAHAWAENLLHAH